MFTLAKLFRDSADTCPITRVCERAMSAIKLDIILESRTCPREMDQCSGISFVPEQAQCERGLYFCRRGIALPIGHLRKVNILTK